MCALGIDRSHHPNMDVVCGAHDFALVGVVRFLDETWTSPSEALESAHTVGVQRTHLLWLQKPFVRVSLSCHSFMRIPDSLEMLPLPVCRSITKLIGARAIY